MSPHATIQKVLIIGSGPIHISQSGAFDEAATVACNVLKAAGLETIMVHCDPSALSADADMADRTYLVPLSLEALTDILEKEKPDAILPTVGGPQALQTASALAASGALDNLGIELLGVAAKSLVLVDDPGAFPKMAEAAGWPGPRGQNGNLTADVEALAEKFGYPVFVRSVEPGGVQRHGIAFNVDELHLITAGGRLPSDITGRFRVETALSGYMEIEVTVLRDGSNAMQIAGMAENLDPVGIHSGDSTAVTPVRSIDSALLGKIENAALALTEKAGITGSVSFKFAVHAKTGEILPLAVDMGYGRSAAFFSKAFDIPLATIHARLSLGMDLDAAASGSRSTTGLSQNEAVVAVRLPHWEFERFPGEVPHLDARMKSTGAAMGVGQTFLQALVKAQRASFAHPISIESADLPEKTGSDTLLQRLVVPSPDRLGLIQAALRQGVDMEAVASVTGVALHWIRQLADLADLKKALCSANAKPFPAALADRALSAGFNADAIAEMLTISVDEATTLLSEATLTISGCAVADSDAARICFNGAVNGRSACAPLGKSVLIATPGIARIGQSIELDHGCVHAARALRAAGRKVVLVSANPASAVGGQNIDRTYVEPMTAGDIRAILKTEKPEGVILQFGGYRAMKLGSQIAQSGFSVLGTPQETITLSQNRFQFSALLTDLGIPHPQMGIAESPDKAMDLAESIGYPLLVSAAPGQRLRRQTIIMDTLMLEKLLMTANVSGATPIVLEQFIEYAIEVEADALCDGKAVYVPTVMEHIELAGVHPGDSSVVVPPYSTSPRHVETIGVIIEKIALELGIKGLLNIRFAVLNDTVYLREVRPWACRTLPMVSKICNVPMAQRAVEIMLGMTLEEVNLPRCLLPHYTIRSSVFPFDTFTEADPLLGPRMRSTGQAMVMATGFGMSYFSSQEAAGPSLPIAGKVLITVTDADKPSILEPARLFKEMGFGIQATRGTHSFLKKNGIEAQLVKKLGFGRPDLVDAIKTGEVVLVINTPSGTQSHQDDAYIRKTANRYRIPNITTPAGALAAAKGIAARKRGQDALRTLQSYTRSIR